MPSIGSPDVPDPLAKGVGHAKDGQGGAVALTGGMDARYFDAVSPGQLCKVGKETGGHRPTLGYSSTVLDEDGGVPKGQAGGELNPEQLHVGARPERRFSSM